ncbi:MAG: DUF4115 domain-containing protein [Pseudomonadota bacterium]|nr:DUF4115 domain-containing protein [Pseudomonadota bacterium]MDP1902992.1 DUF4115 domain-containing protein [Pseudomonadota bacterium]MDP2352236.1 DUF4115 domain-containing protein [Pseudomonadota bacterium]
MSATEQPLPQTQAETPPSTHSAVFHPGFGDKLKLGREALGLTFADVAAKLKLSERQIEAMEAEDFAHLPGEVFSRGFVRNYARLLNVDPALLIVPVDIHAAVAETITAPSENVIFSSPGLRRWVLLPLLVLGFFVLLVALLYYWLRQGEDALIGELATAPAAVTMSQPAPVSPLPLSPLPPVTPEAAAVVDAATPPEVPVSPAPATAATMAPPAMLPLAAVVAPTPVPTAGGKVRTLRFAPSLDSWIQVVDGQGKRYSKLVRAGSVEMFAGEPPFKLVVGEAAQVKLNYDGHLIDLTPYIGQKVARLTLE